MMRKTNGKSRNMHAKGQHQKAEKAVTAQPDGTAVKHKKHRLNKKHFLKFILVIILLMIIAVAAYAGMCISQAPKIDPHDIYDILSQSTVIYDDDGEEIETVYTEADRSNVSIDEIPENLQNAFVALEDKTFWDHHGFNFVRILGAIKDSLTSGSVSGTSTITQQLARNVFLREDMQAHTMKRKIQEAYYTIIIEKELSKKEILEAYLNTIYFGYHSNGVQAASQAYFSKDVNELTLAQCAALASLPQAPSKYQLVEFVDNNQVSPDNKDIIKRTPHGTYLANDLSHDRRITCLSLMNEQGYITDKQYEKASKAKLRKMLNPKYTNTSTDADYFADYVIDEVISDLMEEHKWDYETAWNKVYDGGVKIYSTLDSTAQSVINREFENDANFPYAIYSQSGEAIVNQYGQPVLYSYDSYFDNSNVFTFRDGEALMRKDGSMLIRDGKRLNIYDTEVNGKTDYSIEFKNMYKNEDGRLYSISGGFINIPQEFKSRNSKGNIVVSADFFKNDLYKDFFIIEDGTISIPPSSYTLNQKVVQPQAAMTIVENSTGYIKAMVGGRKTSGKRLFNRATSPRQPGSSIKPLGVYSAAIQQSAEESAAGKKHSFTDFHIDDQGTDLWGDYLTAGSIVVDEKTTINGKVWPENAGGGYSGPMTMRRAMQLSVNTCAVKILLQVGESYSADLIRKYGITTLDDEGDANDINPAALALGGMTNGVTTLEMANAYTTFPNGGNRHDATSYYKVVDTNGKVILENKKSKSYEVIDPGVAFIMTDMLKSVVSNGIGSAASVPGIQVGGKTGTTDDQFDIWFDGFTPAYSASLWIGNDQNLKLSSMSGAAASLWGKIMNQIPKAKQGSYKSAPSNVIRTGGEYFIRGTEKGRHSIGKLEKEVLICEESGYIATPDCKHVIKKKFSTYGDDKDKMPKYYCYMHNSDPEKYPISPDETLVVEPEPEPEVPDPDVPEPEKPEVILPEENEGETENPAA